MYIHVFEEIEYSKCMCCCWLVNCSAGNVKAINLGDSGIVHFRQGDDGEYKIGAVSDEQTLGFNMPRQLGTGSNDTPTIGQRLSFSSKPGDLGKQQNSA